MIARVLAKGAETGDEIQVRLVSADIDRRVSEVYDPRNAPEDSRRYLLNVATAAASAWVTREQWEALAAPTKIITPARRVLRSRFLSPWMNPALVKEAP